MSPHILFVDDEAPIRELLSLYFRQKGWRVGTAVDAQEARAALAKESFQLIILDVNLGGENGLDLLKFLRANYPNVPVVMFTGLTGEELLESAMAAGASGFMRKTDSLDALFQEVSRHLPPA